MPVTIAVAPCEHSLNYWYSSERLEWPWHMCHCHCPQIVSWLRDELADLMKNTLLRFLYTTVDLSQRHKITGRRETFKWLETFAFAFQGRSFCSFPTFLVQNLFRKGISCLECKWAQVISTDCIHGYCCWCWLLLIAFTSNLLKRKTVIRAIIGAT